MAGQCPTWFKETETGSCECGPELGGVSVTIIAKRYLLL